MGVQTRGLDISLNAKRQVADAAARAEAQGVIERWNEQLAASRDILWSPTIRAGLIAMVLLATLAIVVRVMFPEIQMQPAEFVVAP
jgi:hypothetical protein